MRLLLTSFGVSHLQRRDKDNPDVFYRMPPVSMSQVSDAFLPDYAVLLLAHEVILDRKTYDRLMRGLHPAYSDVAVMIRALYDEGFVRIEDFDAVISENRSMLDSILKRDLRELDLWVKPLKESTQAWREFMELVASPLREDIYRARYEDRKPSIGVLEKREQYQRHMSFWLHSLPNRPHHHGVNVSMLVEEALGSSKKRKKSEYREALRTHLAEYLSYVNANLLLSQTFGCGFHDWYDFQPFYKEKFLRVAADSSPGENEIANVKKLFEISFPEFTFWHPDNVIRALKDSRIEDLRHLVDEACQSNVEFDKDFANHVLSEVFKIESSLGTFRKVVSYVTAPLGFIPTVGTPVQKAVEEAIVRPTEKRRKEKFRWFYLISELAKKGQRKSHQRDEDGE